MSREAGERTGRMKQVAGTVRTALWSAGEAGAEAYWKVFGFAAVGIAAAALLLSLINFFYAQAAHGDLFAGREYKVVIETGAARDVRPMVEAYMKDRPDAPLKLASEGDDAAVYIGKSPRKGFDSSRFEGRPALELTAGARRKVLNPRRYYWFSGRRTGILLKVKNRVTSDLEEYLRSYYDSAQVFRLTAVGDIIPARHVAESMAEHGVSWPFELIAPVVSRADITYGSLECPLTDRFEVPFTGMEFVAPAKTIRGVKMMGIDVVTLANNHSTNFGRDALTDTIELLKKNGIEYTGGGYDYDEARRPALLKAGVTKFAFLNYNSIKGSLDATATEPGVAWMNMQPWYPDSEEDFAGVEADIREAKKKADFVVVGFHWSKEYEFHPNASMVTLAHRACDAGADMVIGQHPHSVQSIEYYKGKFIAYCLGNFVFDQRFSEQVRHGFVLDCGFRNGVLVSLDLLPYRINDACQTVPYASGRGQFLLDKVFRISGWKLNGTSIN